MTERLYPIRSRVDKLTKDGINTLAAISFKRQELVIAELLEAVVKKEIWSLDQKKRTGRRIERRIKHLTKCIRRLEKEIKESRKPQKPATKVAKETYADQKAKI